MFNVEDRIENIIAPRFSVTSCSLRRYIRRYIDENINSIAEKIAESYSKSKELEDDMEYMYDYYSLMDGDCDE